MRPAAHLAAAVRRLAFAGVITALPSPAGPGAGQPFLTILPRDSGIAMSWLEPRAEGGHRLRHATFSGTRWSSPTTIAEGDSFFVNWADFPSIAVSGGPRENTLAAHWLWKVGAGTYAYQVRLAVSEGGGKNWTGPIVPHRDATETEHGFVSLGIDEGGIRAVWLDGRNTGGDPPGAMTLRTARVAPDGRMTDEQELDGSVCDCCATALAPVPGGFVVAYRDRSAEEVRDISVVRRANGTWSPPVTPSRDGWKINGCPVNGPALAAFGKQVILAWFTAAADSPRVNVAVSADGGATFGTSRQLSVGSALGRVDLASFGRGGVVVSWMEREPKGERVRLYHQVRTPAGTWRPRRAVDDLPAARSSGVPQLVVQGKYVVFAWTETGKPGQIRLKSYRLDPADE